MCTIYKQPLQILYCLCSLCSFSVVLEDGRKEEKGKTKPSDGKEAFYSFELVLDQPPQMETS